MRYKTLADRLSELRREYPAFTTKAVCEATGLGSSIISRMFGGREVSISTLEKVTSALNSLQDSRSYIPLGLCDTLSQEEIAADTYEIDNPRKLVYDRIKMRMETAGRDLSELDDKTGHRQKKNTVNLIDSGRLNTRMLENILAEVGLEPIYIIGANAYQKTPAKSLSNAFDEYRHALEAILQKPLAEDSRKEAARILFEQYPSIKELGDRLYNKFFSL